MYGCCFNINNINTTISIVCNVVEQIQFYDAFLSFISIIFYSLYDIKSCETKHHSILHVIIKTYDYVEKMITTSQPPRFSCQASPYQTITAITSSMLEINLLCGCDAKWAYFALVVSSCSFLKIAQTEKYVDFISLLLLYFPVSTSIHFWR